MAFSQAYPAPAPSGSADADRLFTQLEAYPWSTDAEFQSGLSAILGPSPSQADAERSKDLTIHARCFYYTRKFNVPVDFEAYKAWRAMQPKSALSLLAPNPEAEHLATSLAPSPANNNTPTKSPGPTASVQSASTSTSTTATGTAVSSAAPVLSFQEVMELVKAGKPIPGIETIPDTVLEGKATMPTKSKRRKPWETARDGGDAKAPGLFS